MSTLRKISLWFARIWFAQHNARVLAEMEWRFSLFLEDATGGRMSKPYYTIEAMRAELKDATAAIYQDGYDDAIDEMGGNK